MTTSDTQPLSRNAQKRAARQERLRMEREHPVTVALVHTLRMASSSHYVPPIPTDGYAILEALPDGRVRVTYQGKPYLLTISEETPE